MIASSLQSFDCPARARAQGVLRAVLVPRRSGDARRERTRRRDSLGRARLRLRGRFAAREPQGGDGLFPLSL